MLKALKQPSKQIIYNQTIYEEVIRVLHKNRLRINTN